VFVKPKPQSTREKSGKKPGGQPGHKGHGPVLFDEPTTIIEKKPCACGNCGKDVAVGEKYARRQVVDIDIVLNITEERVFTGVCPNCGNIETGQFDDCFKGPLQYGVNAKSFIALLNTYGCVADLKTAEIINSISGGAINISAGTVVNYRRELSNKLEDVINSIRESLILSKVLNGDETGVRVNGKLKWGQIFCNDNFALYGINGKRGDVDESMRVLMYFTGILVHDHFMSYYKHETITHAECNQHILRYLKGLVEIFQHSWFKDMSELLKTMCHEKNELIRVGKKFMPTEKLEEFSKKYDEILERGWAEYKASTQGNEQKEKYYNDERCLLTRLGEFKKEHLLFLNDFDVPFTNNNAEQGIRVLKTKQKVSGGFRSDEGAEWFLRIMSLIVSLKKQKLHVFEGIRSVFLGLDPFAATIDSISRHNTCEQVADYRNPEISQDLIRYNVYHTISEHSPP
jgi:transposase